MLAFKAPIALAVISAASLDPPHAAVAVVGLVGVVLIEAGVHPCLSSRLPRILRRNRRRKHGVPACRELGDIVRRAQPRQVISELGPRQLALEGVEISLACAPPAGESPRRLRAVTAAGFALVDSEVWPRA